MKKDNLKVLRDFWGVPAITMSRLCGFGVNQWREYENGSAEPTRSNAHLVRLIANPYVFRDMVAIMPEDERLRMGKRYGKLVERADKVCKAIDRKAEDAKQEMAFNWCY